MELFLLVFLLFAGIAGMGVLMIVMMYNGLVSSRNKCENAWSQIEVQLNRRADLIPNLVETVKGYMSHEKEVLEEVTKARSALMKAEGVQDNAKADDMLTGALKSLFAVAENYPDLKANQNFLKLQEELAATENKVAYARQFYNDCVYRYDTKRQTFPTNIIASMFNFVDRDYFEVEESKKENVEVDF